MSGKKYEYDAEDARYAARTAIHEHFHHVQNQLGILSMSKKFDADEMEVSRRIELQDICSTSRLQLTLNLGITADDYKSFLKPRWRRGARHQGDDHPLEEPGFYMTTLQVQHLGGSSREVA